MGTRLAKVAKAVAIQSGAGQEQAANHRPQLDERSYVGKEQRFSRRRTRGLSGAIVPGRVGEIARRARASPQFWTLRGSQDCHGAPGRRLTWTLIPPCRRITRKPFQLPCVHLHPRPRQPLLLYLPATRHVPRKPCMQRRYHAQSMPTHSPTGPPIDTYTGCALARSLVRTCPEERNDSRASTGRRPDSPLRSL